MSRLSQIITASLSKVLDSACSYEDVDVSGGDYVPEHHFKGIHVNGAGDIAIVGLDGVSSVLTVTQGGHPYGGAQILQTGTTATGIKALR